MITRVETSHLQVDVDEFIKSTTRTKKDYAKSFLFFKPECAKKTNGVLGIDPSLSALGYFFYKEPNVFISGHFSSSTKESDRLREISHLLVSVLLDLRPSVIYLENYAHDAPFKSHELGELGGLVRIILDEYTYLHEDTKFVKLSPSSAKLFFAAYGKAKKPEMVLAAREVFGLVLTSEDEADAAGLCYAGIQGYTPPPPPPKKPRKPKKIKEVTSTDEAPKKRKKQRGK